MDRTAARAKLTTAIIRGTGVGQPMGLLSSPAKIEVPRSRTSVTADAAKMWRRLHPGGRANAVWIVHADVDVPTTPGLPLLLHGRPVIAAAACSAPGTAGDILLADLSSYMLVMRRLKTDVSMHFYFDAAAMAYRVVWRVDGACLWASAQAPQQGSDTLSPVVTLAAAS